MKKIVIILALSAAIFVVYPHNAHSDIIITGIYREVDAGISATYYDNSIFNPQWKTVTDDPPGVGWVGQGAWTLTATAYVSWPLLNHATASASQDSTMYLDPFGKLIGAGSGSVRVDKTDEGTWSIYNLNFTIDVGQYSYNLTVNSPSFGWGGACSVNGSFEPNTTGLIGPGNYLLSLKFYDVNAVHYSPQFPFMGDDYYYTPYDFSFVVSPYSAPPVPLPGTALLLGSGLIRLAAYRRRRGSGR